MMQGNRKLSANILAIAFLLPSMVLLVMFVYGPLVSSFGYAFTKFENFAPIEFVGLKNFMNAFNTKQFWNALQLTFKWVALNTFLPTFFGMVLALLMEFFTKRRVFVGITRTILFIPMMMSLVAVGILWSLVFDPNIGIIGGVAKALGYPGKINMFADTSLAIVSAFIPIIWKDAGFSMVIFSAAAQGISKDVIEASVVEGASKMEQIRHIMLPSMMNTCITVLLINMISGFKAFDMLYALTRGGPGAATNVMAIYSYEQAFTSFKFDYSSAIMTVQFVCVVAFIVLFNLLTIPIKKKYSTE